MKPIIRRPAGPKPPLIRPSMDTSTDLKTRTTISNREEAVASTPYYEAEKYHLPPNPRRAMRPSEPAAKATLSQQLRNNCWNHQVPQEFHNS